MNILKKLGTTDYVFADFLARLLTYDPRKSSCLSVCLSVFLSVGFKTDKGTITDPMEIAKAFKHFTGIGPN